MDTLMQLFWGLSEQESLSGVGAKETIKNTMFEIDSRLGLPYLVQVRRCSSSEVEASRVEDILHPMA
eukprot:3011577-Amphidinium_carterae.1